MRIPNPPLLTCNASTAQPIFSMAAASDTAVNSLHPSVVDKIDADFARIYNRFQGSLDPWSTPKARDIS